MFRTGCVASGVLLIAFLIANPTGGQETIGVPSHDKASTLPGSRAVPGAFRGDLLGALMDLLYQLGFVNRQIAVPPRNAVAVVPERASMKKMQLEQEIRGMADAIRVPLQEPSGLQGLRRKLLDNSVKGQERLK